MTETKILNQDINIDHGAVTGLADDDHTQYVLKENSITNVKDFGAVGDGVTDDTSAIQAAIDAAHANGGGIVFFPNTLSSYYVGTLTLHSGHYYGLTLRSNVWLVGEGNATIKVNATSSGFLFINEACSYVGATWAFAATPDINIRIQNLRFSQVGNSTIYFMEAGNINNFIVWLNYIDFGLPGYGVFVDIRGAAKNIHIDNNHYLGEGGTWLRPRAMDSNPDHDISGVWITDNYLECYSDEAVACQENAGRVRDIYIKNNVMVHDSNIDVGFLMGLGYDGGAYEELDSELSNINIISNTFISRGTGLHGGIHLGYESIGAAHIMRNIRIENNEFRTNSFGVLLQGGTDVQLLDNTFYDGGSTASHHNAIYYYYVGSNQHTVTVRGNTVTGWTTKSTEHAIELIGGSATWFDCSDNKVINIITGGGITVTNRGNVKGNYVSGADNYGIFIQNGNRMVINDNTVVINGAVGISLQNSSYCNLIDNVADGNTTYAYLAAGTSDYNRWVNNRSTSNGTDGITSSGAHDIFRDNMSKDSNMDHTSLVNLNSTTHTHLTAANHTDLTDGGATTLHKHDHGGMDGLNDDDHTQYVLRTDVASNNPTLAKHFEGVQSFTYTADEESRLVLVFTNTDNGYHSGVITGIVTVAVAGLVEGTSALVWAAETYFVSVRDWYAGGAYNMASNIVSADATGASMTLTLSDHDTSSSQLRMKLLVNMTAGGTFHNPTIVAVHYSFTSAAIEAGNFITPSFGDGSSV